MSRWWRAYDEAVEDPKLQRLPDRVFKGWFNLMCIASRNGGRLPSVADVAFTLRKTEHQVAALCGELHRVGLLDKEDGSYRPHNWDARQFKSDVSTERVKRFRERPRNVSETVSETPPETEQRQSRADIAADAASTTSGKYAFEDGVIRLSAKDFSAWEKNYPRLDLRAELSSLARWATTEQGPENWFHAVKGALAKRNREAKERSEKPANGTGNPLFEGIT